MRLEKILMKINGSEIPVQRGATVAAAILKLEPKAFRNSISGMPRFPICGMGICFECRVTINGVTNQRSCQILAEDGMNVETDE